ncbi:hypothetical protein MG293_002236 [Ovis ammon polii]|uniref:Uncharacterized protein n=1 Tax=Ovis ammon polii TaxID=230172 RepID=A0AAD4UPC6_OVIAM|nr:hypothetical protein MG293_002236 [Ovis ammon polii]
MSSTRWISLQTQCSVELLMWTPGGAEEQDPGAPRLRQRHGKTAGPAEMQRRAGITQGKEQRLCFAGAAMKRYPKPKDSRRSRGLALATDVGSSTTRTVPFDLCQGRWDPAGPPTAAERQVPGPREPPSYTPTDNDGTSPLTGPGAEGPRLRAAVSNRRRPSETRPCPHSPFVRSSKGGASQGRFLGTFP